MPLTLDLLKKFKGSHQFMVETGMHRGDGIALGLEAGFERVYSCDHSVFAYGWCSHRFHDDNYRVHLGLMESPKFVWWMFMNLRGPFLFWLDAHWCGGNGEMDGQDSYLDGPAPLLEELEIIAESGIREHTILIDDVRMFGQDVFPSHEQVLEVLHRINPDYQIWYEDCDFPGDVLVAQP